MHVREVSVDAERINTCQCAGGETSKVCFVIGCWNE